MVSYHLRQSPDLHNLMFSILPRCANPRTAGPSTEVFDTHTHTSSQRPLSLERRSLPVNGFPHGRPESASTAKSRGRTRSPSSYRNGSSCPLPGRTFRHAGDIQLHPAPTHNSPVRLRQGTKIPELRPLCTLGSRMQIFGPTGGGGD